MSSPRLPPLTTHFPKWSRTAALRSNHHQDMASSSPPSSSSSCRQQLCETDFDHLKMTSKVLVKMPEVPFTQVKKPTSTSKQHMPPSTCSCGDTLSVYQLQENIKFLQTKHQIMLSRLHEEVDVLRQKNRDLQFQIVFSKNNSGGATNADNDGGDDNDATAEAKGAATNDSETTPPQIQESDEENYKKRCALLEKELAATKVALQTSLARTAALQALLQQHKIPEVPWSSQQQQQQHQHQQQQQQQQQQQHHQQQLQHQQQQQQHQQKEEQSEEAGRLQARLDEAERLVKRLRAETDEQRRELQSIKASLSAGGRGNGGGRGGHRPGPLHQRFPPLQSTQQQPFWQQQNPPPQQRETNDYQVWNRGNRRNNDKVDTGIQGVGINNALPDLRGGGNSQGSYNNVVGNSNGSQNVNQSRRGMGNHGYNNHYYRNSERGHRSDARGYREDEHHQHKTYNTPVDQSEGEMEENVRSHSYKNKRGHNKHQEKS